MMSALSTVKVSNRGQMSLPASARRRWGFEDGGEIGVIDLDGALLLVPGGIQAAKKALAAAIGDGRYEQAVAEISDPDLMN
jgi:AbrB family looped-hinge helix DNA binding protein